MSDVRVRVWVLYRANARQAQADDDPARSLEGFATIKEATDAIAHRMAFGQGVTAYVSPEYQQEQYQVWPDGDKDEAYASVWLGRERYDKEPDATSEPDETWKHRRLMGVERIKH